MKQAVHELALFGGEPAFPQPLHVGRPCILEKEKFLDHVEQVLDSAWLTNSGPKLQELERRLADYLGVRHCICTSSGTLALEVAIRAAGLEGEVIVPSFTFVATAHALQWLGIRPVFCDIDPATHNIDPRLVPDLITDKTTGILGVHVWGRPCDIGALADVAAEHDLRLIFDAAHAFGCSHEGRRIGGFGDAEVFSFHATKFFSTFEGGAIATNDDELASKAKLMRSFGFETYDRVVELGTNGKMNEISAAMGLVQLDQLDERLSCNRRNYRLYRMFLDGLPGCEVLDIGEPATRNFQYVCVEIDRGRAGFSRDELVEILHRENILARRYFFPGCHKMEPYRSWYPEVSLPRTDEVAERVICLPAGGAVSAAEIKSVCELIRLVWANHREIRNRVRAMRAGPETRVDATAS